MCYCILQKDYSWNFTNFPIPEQPAAIPFWAERALARTSWICRIAESRFKQVANKCTYLIDISYWLLDYTKEMSSRDSDVRNSIALLVDIQNQFWIGFQFSVSTWGETLVWLGRTFLPCLIKGNKIVRLFIHNFLSYFKTMGTDVSTLTCATHCVWGFFCMEEETINLFLTTFVLL